MKKYISIMILMFCFSQAYAAGSLGAAKVVRVRVDLGGQAMIFFDRAIEGTPPSCVDPVYTSALAVDANTVGGRAVLSLALTAKTTGDFIDVFGMGVCGIYGGAVVETWNYGIVR